MTLVVAKFGMADREDMQASATKAADLSTMKPGTNTSFDPLKQINAGVLNSRYAESGLAALVLEAESGKRRPQLRRLENRLTESPVIAVPTITIASDFDRVTADVRSYARQFSGKYAHRIFKGIGHNVPQKLRKLLFRLSSMSTGTNLQHYVL